MSRTSRTLALVLSALILGLLALPASAHVTANPNEARSPYFKTDFRVPHGCDGEATTGIRVAIPDGVSGVKPQVVPGWEIETVIGDLAEPIDSHGQTITEGVREVIWRGGPLPDEHLQEFGVSMRLPDTADDDVLWFPVVQECGDAEHAWIEIPETVGGWDDLDAPAPYVTLASTGGHGEETAEEPVATPAAGQADLASDTSAGGAGDALGIAALVAGLLGLGLGGAAFARTRTRA